MKQIILSILLLIIGCSGKNATIKSSRSLHDQIGGSTVALVSIGASGVVKVYCSGIWVSEEEILTAGHCVENGDNSDPIGGKIYYVIGKEVHEIGEDPAALHLGKVIGYDEDHDLALIKADKRGVPSIHEVASLSNEEAVIGDHLYVVGHPRGAYWSYTEGTVSAYREESSIGKVIQFNGTVWYGNSGGGLFNKEGKLLGVCSRLTKIPNMSLFVHKDSIKKFIKEVHEEQ